MKLFRITYSRYYVGGYSTIAKRTNTMYLRGISSPCIAWNTIHEIDFYPVLPQREFIAESIHCFEVAWF